MKGERLHGWRFTVNLTSVIVMAGSAFVSGAMLQSIGIKQALHCLAIFCAGFIGFVVSLENRNKSADPLTKTLKLLMPEVYFFFRRSDLRKQLDEALARPVVGLLGVASEAYAKRPFQPKEPNLLADSVMIPFTICGLCWLWVLTLRDKHSLRLGRFRGHTRAQS